MISSGCDEGVCTTFEQNGVNICRLCGQIKCEVIRIFSEEAHRKHLLLKIQTRLLIQISASDPLPKSACINCLEKLDSLWDFFEDCRKTQIKLREAFLKQRRVKQVTLREQAADHQGSAGTLHPPCRSLNSISHQTTQDTSDSASGNKRIKLELVPSIESLKEELVCLEENSPRVIASTVTSSAESQELYQNDNREVSTESSKNSNGSVRLDHQQETDTIVKKLCLSEMVDDTVWRNKVVLQDSGSGEGIDGRSTASLRKKKNDYWKTSSSDLEDSSIEHQEVLQDVLEAEPVIDKKVSLGCASSRVVQEKKSRSSPVISVSQGESHDNVLLDRTDSLKASTRTGQGRNLPLRSFVLDSEIQGGVSLIGTENCIVQPIEENISMRSSLSCRNNQESLQQMTGNSSVQCSSENIHQAVVLPVNTGENHILLEKDENSMLGSLLCAHENLDTVGRATLIKEATDTKERKSVSRAGIKCCVLKEKDKTSASNNTVSLSDTVNSYGKLHNNDDDDDDGGGSDNNNDDDSRDSDNSFSCHDCDSSFSCKNSLTDHIFKQHMHAGQLNTLHAIPPTLKSSDSSIKKLSSFNDGSVHTANSCTVLALSVTSSAESQELYQNGNRELSTESSKNSNTSVRLNRQQESDTIVTKLSVSEMIDIVRRNMLLLQDCDSGVSLRKKKNDYWKTTSSDLEDSSLEHQEVLQNVLEAEPVIAKKASLGCASSSAVQEKKSRSSPLISVSRGESHDNALLDRTDSLKSSTRTGEGRYSPVGNFVSGSEIQRGVPLIDTDNCIVQQIEKNISMRSSLPCRKNQEALQQMTGNSSVQSSSENIHQAGVLSVNTGPNHVQLEKDENNMLGSMLCARRNLDKVGRATLQKEAIDTHIKRSVSWEGKKCSVLKEKDKTSDSNNTVSLNDTVNSCHKLNEDDDGDNNIDDDWSDCDNSFSCHDCGSSFSCKNSLTDHIFKQHMHAGQTNTLRVTPPTRVTLKGSDSSVNKLSSSDVGSVHNANTSDSVLQKPETDSKTVQTQDKPTEDAQASNCKVPSVDDKVCVVAYDSTSNNRSYVKPLENELRPTTFDEARLMCEKYFERICETAGGDPKINMINIKFELTSRDSRSSLNYDYTKFVKPFTVLKGSRYDCLICKTTLNNRVAILKHIGKHFNLFPYSCKICDRRYTIKNCANEHMKIHFTKLICERCGVICNSSAIYITHMLGHTKPFSCHDCGERFSSKARVGCHIWREHMKIRSYACKICGKAYFHDGNVATHMIFAHADRKIVCQYCGKMYFRNNMLKEHIRRWHT